MMMYGEGPPPPTLREHHHHHNCWPLIRVTAIDFHYVIVLRVAIHYWHFTCLVRSTSYDLCIASCLRVWHAHSFTNTLFQSCVFMFWSCISHIYHTSFVNSFCPNQGPAVVVVVVFPECRGWLALPVHHHLVVQNGILGFHFVFVFKPLFLIFGLLS